jgi:hypothetical protein
VKPRDGFARERARGPREARRFLRDLGRFARALEDLDEDALPDVQDVAGADEAAHDEPVYRSVNAGEAALGAPNIAASPPVPSDAPSNPIEALRELRAEGGGTRQWP